MRHLDLFSGIGTWALASKEVWPDREMVGFCENDHFASAVLTKHFPDVTNYGDIIAFADALRQAEPQLKGSGATEGQGSPEPRHSSGAGTGHRAGDGHPAEGVRELGTSTEKLYGTSDATDTKSGEPGEQKTGDRGKGTSRRNKESLYDLDILTASPPCQAASTAGKRKGTDDARWLWPSTVDVLGRLQPRWCILENVLGLLSLEGGLAFDKICTDVEAQGYEVWPVVLPACGVDAPHQRYRVWLVGRRKGDTTDPSGQRRSGGSEDGRQVLGSETAEVQAARPGGEVRQGDATYSDTTGSGTSSSYSQREGTESCEERQHPQPRSGGQGGDDTNPTGERLGGGSENGTREPSGLHREGTEQDQQDAANSQDKFSERREPAGDGGRQPKTEAGNGSRLASRDEWLRDWREVADRTCREVQAESGVWLMDDGPSDGLPRLPRNRRLPDKTVSASKWRTESLKAVGNGIVGQVAVEIMKAIKEADV